MTGRHHGKTLSRLFDEYEELQFLPDGDWHDWTSLGTITHVDGTAETVYLFMDNGRFTREGSDVLIRDGETLDFRFFSE